MPISSVCVCVRARACVRACVCVHLPHAGVVGREPDRHPPARPLPDHVPSRSHPLPSRAPPPCAAATLRCVTRPDTSGPARPGTLARFPGPWASRPLGKCTGRAGRNRGRYGARARPGPARDCPVSGPGTDRAGWYRAGGGTHPHGAPALAGSAGVPLPRCAAKAVGKLTCHIYIYISAYIYSPACLFIYACARHIYIYIYIYIYILTCVSVPVPVSVEP